MVLCKRFSRKPTLTYFGGFSTKIPDPIRPTAVAGAGVGEVAARCAAGTIALRDTQVVEFVYFLFTHLFSPSFECSHLLRVFFTPHLNNLELRPYHLPL